MCTDVVVDVEGAWMQVDACGRSSTDVLER
jgi:hypothetical protein